MVVPRSGSDWICGMMEAFGESRRPQIRQAVRRTFESTGIRFSVIGADRVAVAGGGGSARGVR